MVKKRWKLTGFLQKKSKGKKRGEGTEKKEEFCRFLSSLNFERFVH
jgi:hypothetical protein